MSTPLRGAQITPSTGTETRRRRSLRLSLSPSISLPIPLPFLLLFTRSYLPLSLSPSSATSSPDPPDVPPPDTSRVHSRACRGDKSTCQDEVRRSRPCTAGYCAESPSPRVYIRQTTSLFAILFGVPPFRGDIGPVLRPAGETLFVSRVTSCTAALLRPLES